MYFYGPDMGSTGGLCEWSYRDLSAVTAKKIIVANENYAPSYALAA